MLFKKKFSPDLIDLVEYEKDLLYYLEHEIPLRPPRFIHTLMYGTWTDSELQSMRDNREKAKNIYDRLKKRQIVEKNTVKDG